MSLQGVVAYAQELPSERTCPEWSFEAISERSRPTHGWSEMKRHIAIFVQPFPVLINPLLSIVSTLVGRGYRVSAITTERFRKEFIELGAEVIAFPFSENLYEDSSKTLELVSPHFDVEPPALILHDPYSLAAMVMADRCGVPSIRATPQLAFDDRNIKDPKVPSEFRNFVECHQGRASQYLKEHGVQLYKEPFYSRTTPTIYLYIKELQLNESADDANSIYAGRCAAERPINGKWSCSNGYRPSVLISSSTAIATEVDYYRSCVEAVKKLGWHAILAPGKDTDVAALEPEIEGIEVMRNVPQILAMPHVDLLVGLGGMTTTMEAMYYGVPQLMLTHGHPEAELYAENVQKHGIGKHLRGKSVTSDEIMWGMALMLKDDAISRKTREMKERVRSSLGAVEVVEWMERSIASGDKRSAVSVLS